eukprot:6756013-Pyramimonas_sp.AAC.1
MFLGAVAASASARAFAEIAKPLGQSRGPRLWGNPAGRWGAGAGRRNSSRPGRWGKPAGLEAGAAAPGRGAARNPAALRAAPP